MAYLDRDLSILIVDDDDLDRERVRRYLSRSALHTVAVEAVSGEEALSILQSQQVDCVLMDNQLGDTTGSALLQRVRHMTDYAGPIIMVTGVGNESLVVEAMQEGASDYISKVQMDADRLTRAIMRSMQRHEVLASEKAEAARLVHRVQEQDRALKQRDRTLQDILDQSSNLIGYWDVNERIRFGNRIHADWFGIDVRQLPGKRIQDAFGEALYQVHKPHIELAIRGQPQCFEHELRLGDEARNRILQVEYRPDLDSMGQPIGFYVTMSDMTTLVMARNQAQESARIKAAFLANMSHEIRTPMNAILGLSRLALERTLPDDARDHINRVHEAALALMGILDDILDHSKLESGQMRIDKAPVQLDDVLRRTVDLFSGRVMQKCLTLSLQVDDDVPACIVADALRVSQVLNNLVGNAVKFTEEGGIRLTVTRAGAEGGMLRFQVDDTGIGIDPARQSELFEAFTQGDLSITRRFGGSGLGLSICRSLVSMMQGEIGVGSMPGQGSSFWFTVPLEAARLPMAARPLQGDQAASAYDGRVLLITPDGRLPGLYVRNPALRATEWMVAADVPQALAVIASAGRQCQPIEHILLDCAGRTASELALVVHELWERSVADTGRGAHVVLFIAGYLREGVVRATASAWQGISHVLDQPVMPAALLRALKTPVPLNGDDRHATGAHTIKAKGEALHGRHVMLVEDNQLNQLVAQAFLEQAGLRVTVKENGLEAVEAVSHSEADPFDVILMDMHMPVLDGLAATERIRALPLGTMPIIAMTAAVMQEDRQRCEQAGMVDMIPKPIMAEYLIEVLLKWVAPVVLH